LTDKQSAYFNNHTSRKADGDQITEIMNIISYRIRENINFDKVNMQHKHWNGERETQYRGTWLFTEHRE